MHVSYVSQNYRIWQTETIYFVFIHGSSAPQQQTKYIPLPVLKVLVAIVAKTGDIFPPAPGVPSCNHQALSLNIRLFILRDIRHT